MTGSGSTGVGRRGLFGAGIVALLGAAPLAACADEAGTPRRAPRATPSPAPDDIAVDRARADAADLAAAAERMAAARPDLGPLLDAVAADHRAHLAALGATVTAASPSPPLSIPSPATPSLGPSGTEPTPSGDDALRSLVGRERTAAQTALDAAATVSADLAALLARVAAARAVHADLIAPKAGVPAPGDLHTSTAAQRRAVAAAASGQVPPTAPLPVPVVSSARAAPPTASPSRAPLTGTAGDAFVALTAGEHAAVYAYGVIVARVVPAERARARQAWTWHMVRRDLLEERLLAAGRQPPAAAPAYELGLLQSPPAASSLAAAVEDRVAALTVRSIAAATGADRWSCADALVAGARRAAAWRGHGEALPG